MPLLKYLYVYILKCTDKTYYTGITNNPEKRIVEHNSGINKTSYTYLRRPVEMIYRERFTDYNLAIRWEKRIKNWNRKKKEARPPQKRGRKSLKELDIEADLVNVPEDEILFMKQYYPISEVAGWFNVNTSLIRFWENEFDILQPRKNRKGDRLFRPEDVKNLQLIHLLLRQKKFSIEGAREYIKTNKNKVDVQMQLTQTLQKFKGFLLELKASL